MITEQVPNRAMPIAPDELSSQAKSSGSNGNDTGDRIVVYRWRRNDREDIVVSLGEFRGQRLADLRCYVADNGKENRNKPTQKGISVRVEDLPKLREAVEALIEAENSRVSEIA